MARKGPDYAAPVRRILVSLLVLVLLFRPTGILGRPEVEKV